MRFVEFILILFKEANFKRIIQVFVCRRKKERESNARFQMGELTLLFRHRVAIGEGMVLKRQDYRLTNF